MTDGRKEKKTKKEKTIKFEKAIEILEAIVQELEGSDVPLKEALELFEEGVKLSKVCHQKLSEAEKKVQVLLEGEGGQLRREPFEGEEAGEEGQDEESGGDPAEDFTG